MESSSVMNCLMFCKEDDDLHFFFKLAVMLARVFLDMVVTNVYTDTD